MQKPEEPRNPAPKQPVSEARRAASRTNAAESHDAVKHGILARALTFSDGDAELFDSLHQDYIQGFNPRDQPEHDLIEEAVYAKWQMRQARLVAFAKSRKESNVRPTLERYSRQLSIQTERAIKLFMQLHAQPLTTRH